MGFRKSGVQQKEGGQNRRELSTSHRTTGEASQGINKMLENKMAGKKDAGTIYTRQRTAKPRGSTSKAILMGQ